MATKRAHLGRCFEVGSCGEKSLHTGDTTEVRSNMQGREVFLVGTHR